MSSLLLLSLISGGISPAQAQVRAELLTLEQSAMPGRAITAVLKLDHDPKWHTYWTNPGIGEPTRMDWTLPPGWVAGEIDWPVPRQIYGSDGRITGYGYEDVLHLPVRLIVPQTAEVGKEVTLTATASWLMCEVDICIPGGQTVAVTIPIASTYPKEEGGVKEALAATPMPEAGEGLRVRASLTEADVTLLLEGTSNTAKAFKDPYFYSLDGLVYHDTDQLFQASSDGLAVQLEKDSYYNGPTDTLMGVLAFTDQAGAYRGIFINAPFEATPLSLPQASLKPADEPQKISRWFKALVFALLGGIILNLMPCVLPILSLKALSVSKMRDASPKAAQNDGLAYTAGILVSFTI
ncbi:MAG: protein-disulfide reductase DsbD domain-containing protein, partial [Pseudomonadota bacterium]